MKSKTIPPILITKCNTSATSWPDYDEQGDLYVVNGKELYIYPDRAAFIQVYLSEIFAVADSSRYFYLNCGTLTRMYRTRK